MADVKQRMLNIVNSFPKIFYGIKPTKTVFKLMVEYIDRYG